MTLFNSESRKNHHSGIYLTPAPYTDDESITFHVNLLRSLLAPNNKLLHLGKNSKFPVYLQELQKENQINAKNSEYPAVAALGYAAAALSIWQYKPQKKTNRQKHKRYDPHERFRIRR